MAILRRHCALVGALSLVPIAAFAAGSGTCKYKDQTLTLIDGVIYQQPDSFDEGKKETRGIL